MKAVLPSPAAPALADVAPAPAGQAWDDRRPTTARQRQLLTAISGSPRQVSQRQASYASQPAAVVQRVLIKGADGTVRKERDDYQPKQGESVVPASTIPSLPAVPGATPSLAVGNSTGSSVLASSKATVSPLPAIGNSTVSSLPPVTRSTYQQGLADRLQQRPSIPVNKGTERAVFDSQGRQTVVPHTRAPERYSGLKAESQRQGAELREKTKELIQQDPQKFKEEHDLLRRVTDESAAVASKAGVIPPVAVHQQKIENISHNKVQPAEFRAIIKGQDENTQSAATTSRYRGYATSKGDTPPHIRQKVDEFGKTALEYQSTQRAPTRSVKAAVTNNNAVEGVRHPTTKQAEALKNGGSGHSETDKARVRAGLTEFEHGMKDNASLAELVMGPVMAANHSTLNHMSAPSSASNLPAHDQSYELEQVKSREVTKELQNISGREMGLAVPTTTSAYDAPYAAHDTLTSPPRQKPGRKSLLVNDVTSAYSALPTGPDTSAPGGGQPLPGPATSQPTTSQPTSKPKSKKGTV